METLTFKIEDLIGALSDLEQRNAPKELYILGDKSLLGNTRRVAVIGSRKASKDGFARARFLASALTQRGVTVVSGLAEGIDTAAHTAAMESNGKTIAVLGTPLSSYYPKINKSLQDKIGRCHLLVSQFAENRAVTRENFSMRNRTMALISHASVIVEAADDSGTLYQARETLRLCRPLFILESNTKDSSLTWPKDLIDQGAKILTRDSLEMLFDVVSRKLSARSELTS